MSRPASPGPSAGPQASQQSYYRERDNNSNLSQAPPPTSSHYRDKNGYPVVTTSSSGHVTRESRHLPGPPLPPSSGQAHGPSNSNSNSNSKGRGMPYHRPDKDYHSMYKELKVKVSDIESENDRLYFKILQAKRNIQRAKLERAILYERLGQLPASPIPTTAPLPPHFGPPADLPQQNRHRDRDREAYYQQPIQPTPASAATHTSPPIIHEHQGQIPITHAQQLVTVQLSEGPALVVAGPDGHPVVEHGRYIFASDVAPIAPASTAVPAKRRGGRVSKEVREMREKETARVREREREMQDAAVVMTDMRSAPALPTTTTSNSNAPPPDGPMQPLQSASSSRSAAQHAEMDWEHEHAPGVGVGVDPASPPQPQPQPPAPPSSGHRHTYHTHHHHHSHGGHIHRSHSQSQSQSEGPISPAGGAPPSSHPPQQQQPQGARRIHGHQRVGPGSYVIRDAKSPSPQGLPSSASAGVGVGMGVGSGTAEEQPAATMVGSAPPTASSSRDASGSPN